MTVSGPNLTHYFETDMTKAGILFCSSRQHARHRAFWDPTVVVAETHDAVKHNLAEQQNQEDYF